MYFVRKQRMEMGSKVVMFLLLKSVTVMVFLYYLFIVVFLKVFIVVFICTLNEPTFYLLFLFLFFSNNKRNIENGWYRTPKYHQTWRRRMFNFLTKNVENFGAVTYAQYPTFSKETKKIFFHQTTFRSGMRGWIWQKVTMLLV